MEDVRSEVRVIDWLGVVAAVGRSRAEVPQINSPDMALEIIEDEYGRSRFSMQTQPSDLVRRNLMKLAAQVMRVLAEQYPGDGLEF